MGGAADVDRLLGESAGQFEDLRLDNRTVAIAI